MISKKQEMTDEEIEEIINEVNREGSLFDYTNR